MPEFNRATMSMKSLGTLILESDLKAKDIDKKLNSAVKQLNSGKLTEENVALFCAYVRKLIQILESIRIYVEREQFIEVNVLRKWEGYINKKKISQFDIGARVVGHYAYKKDQHEASWIGYMCVHPDYRGRGIGRDLLYLVLEEAKRLGKPYLRLYTSTDPNEAVANIMYDKLGFVLFGEKKARPYKILFKQLKIN